MSNEVQSHEAEGKAYVMKKVEKDGMFYTTKKTAPSYLRAAETLVKEGILIRKGPNYKKV